MALIWVGVDGLAISTPHINRFSAAYQWMNIYVTYWQWCMLLNFAPVANSNTRSTCVRNYSNRGIQVVGNVRVQRRLSWTWCVELSVRFRLLHSSFVSMSSSLYYYYLAETRSILIIQIAQYIHDIYLLTRAPSTFSDHNTHRQVFNQHTP